MKLGKKEAAPAGRGSRHTKARRKNRADWVNSARVLAKVKPQLYEGWWVGILIFGAERKYLLPIQNIDRDYSNLAPTVHIIRRISDVYKDRVTPRIDQSGRI